jgi:hypothetical protein
MNDAKRFNTWFLNQVANHFSVNRFNMLERRYFDNIHEHKKTIRQLQSQIDHHDFHREQFKQKAIIAFWIGTLIFSQLGYALRNYNLQVCNFIINNGLYNCSISNSTPTFTPTTSLAMQDCTQHCISNMPLLLFLALFVSFLGYAVTV